VGLVRVVVGLVVDVFDNVLDLVRRLVAGFVDRPSTAVLTGHFALFHIDRLFPAPASTAPSPHRLWAGATGLEPATCGFGDRCATNYATPLYEGGSTSAGLARLWARRDRGDSPHGRPVYG